MAAPTAGSHGGSSGLPVGETSGGVSDMAVTSGPAGGATSARGWRTTTDGDGAGEPTTTSPGPQRAQRSGGVAIGVPQVEQVVSMAQAPWVSGRRRKPANRGRYR